MNYLKLLLHPTVKLLLYIDELDIDEVFDACIKTSLSLDKVIESKCGTTQTAISYLLSFSNPIKEPQDIVINKAYHIQLQGISDNGNFTDTGHAFILLNNSNNWFMIDSYIGHRRLTCKIITLQTILNLLSELKQTFNEDLWFLLTECENNDNNTTKLLSLIYQYDYSDTDINENFIQIVQRAKERLKNEDIGISDDHLCLLSPNLNKQEADEYLNSLLLPDR